MTEPKIITLDNPAAMIGTLCYAATDQAMVIDYYRRKYGQPPDTVYVWYDSKRIAQYWVKLR